MGTNGILFNCYSCDNLVLLCFIEKKSCTLRVLSKKCLCKMAIKSQLFLIRHNFLHVSLFPPNFPKKTRGKNRTRYFLAVIQVANIGGVDLKCFKTKCQYYESWKKFSLFQQENSFMGRKCFWLCSSLPPLQNLN